MARYRMRTRSDGTEAHQVRWLEGGKRGAPEQSETFDTEPEARTFQQLVDQAGQQWPEGWIKGVGFVQAEPDPAAVLFGAWAEDYITHLTGIQNRTRADYRRAVQIHMVPAFGDLDVTDPQAITPKRVAAWVNALQTSGLAHKTIANLHGLLYAILQAAVEAEPQLRTSNPCAKTRLPRLDDGEGDEEMVFLTPAEFEVIRAALAPDARDLAAFLFATGLRWGEASALQVRDLDLKASPPTLTVRRAWKREEDGSFVLGPPKTKAARRTIGLSPALVQLLTPLIAGKRRTEFVFTFVDSRPWRRTSEPHAWSHRTFYEQRWLPALAKVQLCPKHRLQGHREQRRRHEPCGCPGTLEKAPRVHDLRHSHVAMLIAANVHLTKIQRRLGHESIQTTSDRYGHLNPELDDRVSDAIDAALGLAGPHAVAS